MHAVRRVLRLATAVLIAAAVLVQFLHPERPLSVAANFFSFFTVQSNVFAAGVLAFLALRRDTARSAQLERVRGTTVLHRIAPVVLVLDWLTDPPGVRIGARAALLWLVYPLAYVLYTLIRGAIVHWYPYPFLDVDAHGYAAVLLGCLVLLAGFVLAALAVAAAGTRLGARLDPG